MTPSVVARLLRRRIGGRESAPPEPPPDADPLNSKLDAMQTQLNYVEMLLEGLQDAVHRRAELEDRRNEELRRRVEPAQLAQDIASDARRRGV